MSYLWDSYAAIELMSANPGYEKYSAEEIRITIFNLVEIYWLLLHEYGEKFAGEKYAAYKKATVELDDATIMEAIQFRKEHRKKALSYADCIGYTYAKRHGMKFLTGDRQFERMPNVEYAK